jgi:hypothetical protein
MDEPAYGDPVRRLLEIGRASTDGVWPHYPTLYGLTGAFVAELARMTTDASFDELDGDSPAVYAPVHAWRALGQLGASAAGAVDALVSLLPRVDERDDDWVGTEVPEVLGLIGPASLPRLAQFLADDAQPPWARVEAGKAIKHVGLRHASARPLCVELLSRQLERFVSQPVELNSFLVAWLIDLQAREAAGVIERAMRAPGRVDRTIIGDWEQVRVDLGLAPPSVRPLRATPWMLDFAVESVLGAPPTEAEPEWMKGIRW